MLPYVYGATQLNALDAKVYLHLDILRILILVSCLSVVTNWITKIYSFLGRGVKEGGKANQSRPVKDNGRASLRRPCETVHTKPD